MGRGGGLTRRSALAAAGAGLSLALAGCLGGTPPRVPEAGDDVPTVEDPPRGAPAAEEDLEAEVERRLAGMTLEQRVAQLFVVSPEALTGVGRVVAAGQTTREALLRSPVGGVVYFGANLVDAEQTREMLANTAAYAREANGLPILLCVDEEGGTVSRVGGREGFGVENVGDMRDVGATGDATRAYDVALHVGTYLADLGFNVDFAPDADVASNPSGTMGRRSFGATAEEVAPMVAAQVRGFADAGVLCAAKHFPGIGGALGDSHDARIYSVKTLGEPRLGGPVPFEAAIAEGVPIVAGGGPPAPSVTGGDTPASLSHEVVTGILREELGFGGVVITDSMEMGAATSSVPEGRVAVEALLAGVDVVLMPPSFEAAYQGVLDAVSSGELDSARVDESVRRVLAVKLGRLGA